MATLAEVKAAIEAQASGTQTLRDEVKKLQGDSVDKESFAKLEALVTDLDEKRQKLETEYLAELKEAKELAEEASLKAGRRGAGTDDGPNEDQIAHKTAFIDYMRGRGVPALEADVKEAEKKALGSATGSGSGVGVPTMIAEEIQTKTNDDSVMAGLVKVVQVGTSDYKELVDKGGMGFGWVGAGDARAATGKPDVYEAEPAMGTVYAYPEAQEEQLDDVFFNIENWLADSARVAFANARDVAIIDGDGTKKPLGMLGTAPVADPDGSRTDMVYQFLASGVADDIGTADKLIELVYLLKAQYRMNANWLLNSFSTRKVRTMKDGNDRFLWTDSLVVGQPASLLGYPVATAEAMPDIAANSTPIAFGDFEKAYTLVERHDLRITPDEITKPGYKKWHIRQRLGGTPTNDDAAKFLKCAA
ncbi:phage major capsid protein [Pacificoceanicola onchidii]|uniref:phage major capsid protein n=1 Tax=Pacificoceanicola onchidii TaxID=2562685 RepID=UPI0010A3D533|nr:phage major capsid protein [Pacificoceanicola onchidii]